MKRPHPTAQFRLILFVALTLTIPAFYLLLVGATTLQRTMGSVLYGISAVLFAADIWHQQRQHRASRRIAAPSALDVVILLGAIASIWPSMPTWSPVEWGCRLAFSALVFLRYPKLLVSWMFPHHLMQVLGMAVVLLAIAGGGFYWLEPKVLTYADGLWLAFTTGATVGYGDLVPSTHASRIFAVFIVLLGYAVFSVVTASIAALFIGEDEKRFQKELHADIRSLRHEIAGLREELHRSTTDTPAK
ncbi:potassium channel family protein [Actimicrobium antarcticum]|uniref:Potassium channel domain-containing protein n=1 Tax=Actimicrobium antarcticum TaxID=1051899 RepID=A0ABP7TUS9_9BURK